MEMDGFYSKYLVSDTESWEFDHVCTKIDRKFSYSVFSGLKHVEKHLITSTKC